MKNVNQYRPKLTPLELHQQLHGKEHRVKREIATEKTEGQRQIEWIPTEEEKKLPKFKDLDES